MPEKSLFEYAVIRVVPCVEREEFLNVGVILFCTSKGFLQTVYKLDKNRLCNFSPEIDMAEIQERLQVFERICAGRKEGGVIGSFPVASRFRWLTANRSTVIQTSPVHPGLCEDPQEKLNQLFTQLVR